ncbi:MAG: YgiT-type zinc finger protein [Myxococcota bacterium]
MKCIGGCPGEPLSDVKVVRDTRPSHLTINGVTAEVCPACGEVVYSSRRSERRLLETKRARRLRRPSNLAMRRAGWSEHEMDWDR